MFRPREMWVRMGVYLIQRTVHIYKDQVSREIQGR
jgi:hypothetical protein